MSTLIAEEDREFGKLLLGQSLVTEMKLNGIFENKENSGEELALILISEVIADSKAVYSCFVGLLEIPVIELENHTIDSSVLEVVPQKLARRYRVLPLFKIEKNLSIVMANSGNLYAITEKPAMKLNRRFV